MKDLTLSMLDPQGQKMCFEFEFQNAKPFEVKFMVVLYKMYGTAIFSVGCCFSFSCCWST